MFKHWKIMDFSPGEGRQKEVYRADYDDTLWIETEVPGDVHSTLIAAGRIPDPFYDRNEREAAWMEKREFWYRGKFQPGSAPAKDERVLLTFHGLDTFAIIYLNGVLLGRAQNMFREFVFDVTGKLHWGKTNTLAVRFDPPSTRITPENDFRSTWGRNPERVFMRKAQFGYGWDWGPRLPTVGIWKPVELKRHRAAALLGVQFNTLRLAADHASALVMVRVEASRFILPEKSAKSAGKLKAEIRLSIPGEKKPVLDESVPLEAEGSLQDVTATYTLENPRLWWPNGIREPDGLQEPGEANDGEIGPFLYDLRVTLRRGKDVLDVLEQRVGVRTLALDQSPDTDEPGTRFFRFVVNGRPIFAKGANWIPADSFVGSITPERYDRLIGLAADANMNMLRIWGGGIYEQDAFYEACDRLGILVWQDFMFTCAMYPENNLMFNAEVEAEARFQVRRLRSHACLALWCGNNENQWLHDRKNPERFPEKVPGALFYDHILPGAVAELDGITPYWPGSPYGGSDYNSMEDGDRHNWQVWHGDLSRRFSEPAQNDHSPEGVSFKHYANDMGRFISEFGMHAAPVMETLKRVIPKEQRFHHSPSMDHHNKDNPKNKGDNLMATVTGLPKDLEQYVDFSMVAQAEGLKFGIEHFRRRMPHCSGALVWQLNDCWPVLSWSVLDYYGFAKAGYFYTARAFAPVLASFQEVEGGVRLWITNDGTQPFNGACEVRLMTFEGETVWGQPVEVDVPPNTSREVARWPLKALAGAGTGADRCLVVRSPDGAFPANRHFFSAVKDLRREPSAPAVKIKSENEHELRVDIHAQPNRYVFFLHLTHPSSFTRYEDNYFDLAPGESRAIRVWNEQEALKAEEIEVKWL